MFTYGSSGYSPVHIGDLMRAASDGLSCKKAPGGPCISRHSANYSCSVTRVSTDGVAVCVGFNVTGDGSLGDLQIPSDCELLFENANGHAELLALSKESQFEYSPNVSSGTLVYMLPARLQVSKTSSNVSTAYERYLSTPQPNAAVAQHFALWISVALAKACCDLVHKLLSSGSLFSLQLLLDSTQQPPEAACSASAILAIVAKLRQENKRVPIAPFFNEVVDAVASGRDRSSTSVDFATALLSAAAPGAFMLTRRALSVMHTQLHASALTSLPSACLVTLPDWVCNATSPQSCVCLPLFFAGRPIIVMPNFGWADVLVASTPKRISVPCACVIAALLSPGTPMTTAQLSDATGLPQLTVSECIKLLLTQNACVSVANPTGELAHTLHDAADWSVDGWLVLNHTSLKASCSFISSDYAAVCHWCGL